MVHPGNDSGPLSLGKNTPPGVPATVPQCEVTREDSSVPLAWESTFVMSG